MKKFKHIVFTRQALYWGRVPMDNDVINYRLDLFEKTLLKSIQRQTDQNFTFVQLVSVQVDQAIKNRIKEYGEIVWVTEIGEHGPDAEALRKYLSKELTDEEIVITTNIDNDDMLGVEYIRDINSRTLVLDSDLVPLLICPKYEYQVSKLGILKQGGISNDSVAPTLTAIESTKAPIKTARFANHDKILPFFKTFRQIHGPALYVVNEASIWRDYGRSGNISEDITGIENFGLSPTEFRDILGYLSIEKGQFMRRRQIYRA